MTDLEAAWDAVHAALAAGWYVGRLSYHDERDEWLTYAFDPTERPEVGLRSRADRGAGAAAEVSESTLRIGPLSSMCREPTSPRRATPTGGLLRREVWRPPPARDVGHRTPSDK